MAQSSPWLGAADEPEASAVSIDPINYSVT